MAFSKSIDSIDKFFGIEIFFIFIFSFVFDPTTRELDIELTAEFFANLSADIRFNAVILEDEVGPYNQSNYYSFQGLRLGLRFKIIEDLKGQVGVSAGYTEFDRTYSGDNWSSPYHLGGPSYIFDLGLITHIVLFDVLFSVGYNLNDMQISHDDIPSDVMNGFFFALGVEWFPWD